MRTITQIFTLLLITSVQAFAAELPTREQVEAAYCVVILTRDLKIAQYQVDSAKIAEDRAESKRLLQRIDKALSHFQSIVPKQPNKYDLSAIVDAKAQATDDQKEVLSLSWIETHSPNSNYFLPRKSTGTPLPQDRLLVRFSKCRTTQETADAWKNPSISTAVVVQSNDGVTQEGLNISALKRLEKHTLSSLLEKTQQELRSRGLQNIPLTSTSSSIYAWSGKVKLAVIRLSINGIRQVQILGFVGDEARRLGCTAKDESVIDIPITHGVCAEKISEVFGNPIME